MKIKSQPNNGSGHWKVWAGAVEAEYSMPPSASDIVNHRFQHQTALLVRCIYTDTIEDDSLSC